ncbi:MAG: glutamate racemase [Bacteroidota bacterium]|nr:glutamate racemase [Bacteroidota bacterium]
MTVNSEKPIGIFDSGIGGLTVANAINKKMPGEKLIYFGDTAHLPYGDKSADSIKYYSIRIAQFLIDNNCKAIVIACNTASSLAFETVKDFVGDKALVFNVIDPVVEKVTSFGMSKIGVIGTKGTIKSNVYATKIKEIQQNAKVASVATPLLAPMIEEGFFNNKISKSIINSYLSSTKLKNIDALILACTHYPLIKPEIEEYYNKKVNILDSAEIVAEHVKKVLNHKGILNSESKPLNHHFYVSDFTESFEQSTRFFFKNKIHLEQVSIWK